MTNRTKWTEYTGSDEQIAELENNKNGYIVRGENLSERTRVVFDTEGIEILPFKYWLIPDDPLRDMKIRQAQTGQPVWVRYKREVEYCVFMDETIKTNTPDWNIPNAEYSFSYFEKEIEFKEEI